MKKLWALSLIIIASTAYAAIYVNNSNPDVTEYSDTPSDNTKEIQAPPINTVNSQHTPAPSASGSTTPAANQAAGSDAAAASSAISGETTYKAFSIMAPKNGDTIQNQPTIPVQMAIMPDIQAGDKIQLYVDGSISGPASPSTYQELGLIDRGTHSVYAEIFNANGQSIKRSNAITLYVQRVSTITSPLTAPVQQIKPPQQ